MLAELKDWYYHIRAHHVEEADQMNSYLADNAREIVQSPETASFYQLLKFRYALLKEDLGAADQLSEEMMPPHERLSQQLSHYYYLFSAIHETERDNYENAKLLFLKAERLFPETASKSEMAEFHYRLAIFHYQTYDLLASNAYVTKALEYFNQKESFSYLRSDCKNILGLCCVELKQFEGAESHFLDALDIAESTGHSPLSIAVRYNLGLLYADQGLSKAAIRHLKQVYSQKFKSYKTAYLLAREYYRIAEYVTARKFLNEAYSDCTKNHDQEYLHHLDILKTFYSSSEDKHAQLESAINRALDYFTKQSLWVAVQKYAELLGELLHDKSPEKCSYYYHRAHLARKMLAKKGGLA